MVLPRRTRKSLAAACLCTCLLAPTFAGEAAARLSSSTIASNRISTEDAWLTWGTYRPNWFLGVRPAIANTLEMGVMWADGQNTDTILESLRDTTDHDDGMGTWGWTRYEARSGGSQILDDTQNRVNMTTDFVKTPDGHGWGVRLRGLHSKKAPKSHRTSVIFHVALEHSKDKLKTLRCWPTYGDSEDDEDPRDGGPPTKGTENSTQIAFCSGRDPVLGEFGIRFFGNDSNKLVAGPSVYSTTVDESTIWEAKEIFSQALKDGKAGSGLTVDAPGEGNVQFVQMVFEGRAPFSVDVIYESAKTNLTPQNITDTTLQNELRFQGRMDSVFPRSDFFPSEDNGDFSRWLISNLMGGLGYFHGESRADLTHAEVYQETEPDFWIAAANARKNASITTLPSTSLLSHTPCRGVFPRGFLWDEGFHLLPVLHWDLDLAIHVLQSWYKLMDKDGWIAREQILGAEARGKVPDEFVVQYPEFANPPTFIALVLPELLEIVTRNKQYNGNPSRHLATPEASTRLLRELYPLFERQYNWFRKTQFGTFKDTYPRPDGAFTTEGYRWRGRTPDGTLTSGLDDYPRANPPHPGELHVDALAWVGASARALQRMATYLGETANAEIFARQLSEIEHNLEVLHWNPSEGAYCDATINDGQFAHVCHIGYMSIYPMLLGFVDAKNPNLGPLLKLISHRNKLWTQYGLRSLSPGDEYYKTQDDYWRSPIWINFNVLAALRLHELGEQPGPLQQRVRSVAADLRKNVVQTVYDNWNRNGFIWEQYVDKTGAGRHSKSFTGWSACVLLLFNLVDRSGDGKAVVLKPTGNGWGHDWLTQHAFVPLVSMGVIVIMAKRRAWLMKQATERAASMGILRMQEGEMKFS